MIVDFCWSCRGITDKGGMYHAVDCDNDRQCEPVLPEDENMYSNKELDNLIKLAEKYIIVNKEYASHDSCHPDDGCEHYICNVVNKLEPIKFKKTSKARLKKILTLFYDGVRYNKEDKCIQGHTKKYKFDANTENGCRRIKIGLSGNLIGLCEGEGEKDSWGMYLLKDCRRAEDFYAYLHKFIDERDG